MKPIVHAFVVVGLLLALCAPALSNPHQPYSRVNQLLRKNDYQAAADAARRLIKKNRRDGQAHYLLGSATLHLKNHKAAIKHFSKAIKLRPDDARPYFSRGMARSHLTQYKAAAKDFEKATELAPKEAIYWLELSQNYARIAESTAESAKSFRPRKLREWYVLGERYWNAGDVTQALNVWERVLTQAPRHWHANLRLGRYDQKTGNLTAATAHYTLLLEKRPHNTHVLENMIQVHNQQGLYEQAEKFRARYLEQRRKQIGRGYAPSRTPHRRIRPRPRFVVDQFRVGRYDIVASEWVNRRKTDALYAFATTTSAKGGPTFTLELDPDQVTHRLIRQEFTPGVASGLGGLNAKAPPPPPPPPPGRTIKSYAEAPTYGDVKRDVIAALQGER